MSRPSSLVSFVGLALTTTLSLSWRSLCVDAFDSFFKIPSFRPPSFVFGDDEGGDPNTLRPGDTVAVIGASGNVGRLVALRASDSYEVRGVVREISSSVRDFLPRASLREVDLLERSDEAALREVLRDAHALVVCTGTTAFPTAAWDRDGAKDVAGDVLRALVDNAFDVPRALAALDAAGLNTPRNVDYEANRRVLETWNEACRVRQKRVVLLSSVGVTRRAGFPFRVLNACGVLDAKADFEALLRDNAAARGHDYTIVRPGQLFGGPYDNNYYLGTLFQLDKDERTRDVQLGLGDELLGDTLRTTLAEVAVRVCETDAAKNVDFAVVNVAGDAPDVDDLDGRLTSLATTATTTTTK